MDASLDKIEWKEIYKRLIYWELELEKSEDESVEDILSMQKSEANSQFFKFIRKGHS